MARQLRLLDQIPSDQWRLDDRTRELGRRGVAEARQVLHELRHRDGAPPAAAADAA